MTVVLERIVGSGDRLVSIHRFHAKAQHTGMEFDESLAYLWTFRHGKVVHLKSFWSRRTPSRARG